MQYKLCSLKKRIAFRYLYTPMFMCVISYLNSRIACKLFPDDVIKHEKNVNIQSVFPNYLPAPLYPDLESAATAQSSFQSSLDTSQEKGPAARSGSISLVPARPGSISLEEESARNSWNTFKFPPIKTFPEFFAEDNET